MISPPLVRTSMRVGSGLALVVLLVGLTAAGWTVGYRLSGRFASPICPYVPGQPQCAVGGYLNSDFYWAAWWFGGALVGLGIGLLIARSVARRVRSGAS